jgi:hypothetical protein
MSGRENVKKILEELGKEKESVHYVSVTPFLGDVSKISSSLKTLGLDVNYDKVTNPGDSRHSFTGNYEEKDGTHGVFVDVSCEKKDCGIVYISSSAEKIEEVKQNLERFLGLKFRRLDNS